MADYHRNYDRDREARRYEDDEERDRRNRQARDEVRPRFDDEEAERRRNEMEDERRYDRASDRRDYGRGYYGGSYGGGYGRGYYGSTYGGGYGGGSFGSTRGGYGSESDYTSDRRDDRYGTYSNDYGHDDRRSSAGEADQRRQSRGPDARTDEPGRDYAQSSWSYTEMWWVPGPHTGRGPRGYQRSDERINEDVNERLQQNGQIDASNISVSVSQGDVTLSGSVNSRFEKRLAEDVAESCTGVKDVQNDLRVSREQHEQASGSQAQPPTGSAQTQSRTQPGATGQPSRSRTTSS